MTRWIRAARIGYAREENTMRVFLVWCGVFVTSGIVGAQSVEQQITEALLPAPESLRPAATVITRDAQGRPSILRQGTNSLVCEPDGPRPGFAVECYHRSFQGVMDWTAERLLANPRTFDEMFVDGGPNVEVSPGAMQYAFVGPTRDQASFSMSIHLPFATAESTGLPTEERFEGPWLMWAGTSAAHIMFGPIPPGLPFDYPGR